MSNVISLFPEKNENANHCQNSSTHATPEQVMNLIQPQSRENNIATKLAKQKLDELFSQLNKWMRDIKNSKISHYEFIQEFLTPMKWIEEIRQYQGNTLQDLGFQKRFETTIPEAYLYIGKMLWIPKGKNIEEEIFRLYEKYQTDIEEGKIWGKKEA